MSNLINQLTIAVFTTFLVACNTASTDSKTTDAMESAAAFDLASAKSTIESQNAKFMDAFKKGDSAAVAASYTSDGVLLPPNSETVQGAGIVSLWGSFMGMGVKEVKLSVDDVAGNAEILSETGRYEIFGAENKMLDKGKYIVVWKPVNGEWKMYRDIWNSSMPAAPAK